MRISKKSVSIIIIVLIVLALVGFGIKLFTSRLVLRDVTFDLSSDTAAITVYENYNFMGMDPTKVATLNNSGTTQLQDGEYAVVPTGKHISTDAIIINVGVNSNSFDIRPPLSDDYLTTILDKELSALQGLIRERYPSIDSDFIISRGSLYLDGSWYATTINHQDAFLGGSDADIYRVILHKSSKGWEIAAPPRLVFSYGEFPGIPQKVINAINQSSNSL
ncbi:hypothetical protein FWF48_00780 [Candidatus Saccharibacteria bacterium]|nr:hypothetical protein [Candidatus Saccharibacteria bacterium]